MKIGLTAAALVLVAATACNESERVDLSFRAPVGSRADYEIAVDASVVTELVGPAETTKERIPLRAQQLVLGPTGGDTELQITMTREGERPRVFEVRLDTVHGEAEVDAVEGLPVEALGELGPSRLILLANGLLPNRSLRPGGEWEINRDLELPEGKERLSGEGRLESLRRDHGVKLARVRATTSLPVERTLSLPGGQARLSGTEHTTAVLDYEVEDGSLHSARSVTTGTFELVVTPPDGGPPGPIEGSLRVRVESTILRLDVPGDEG